MVDNISKTWERGSLLKSCGELFEYIGLGNDVTIYEKPTIIQKDSNSTVYSVNIANDIVIKKGSTPKEMMEEIKNLANRVSQSRCVTEASIHLLSSKEKEIEDLVLEVESINELLEQKSKEALELIKYKHYYDLSKESNNNV